jgi:hypothetical protein
MLRQLGWLYLALFIALVAFIWAASFSSSFQKCVSGAPLKAIEQSITRDSLKTFIGTRVRCTERFAEAHNALITAFGTILLSVITFGLILAAVDQQRTTRAQLRAYVAVDGGSATLKHVVVNGSRDEFIEALVAIKNFGVTPAYNYRSWVRIALCSPNRPPFEQRSEGLGGGIIGPSNGMEIPVQHYPLSASELAEIRAKSLRIFVWGEILYTDAFNVRRYYRFYLRNAKEIPGKGWPLENADKFHEAN